jgi:hypothetical protein
VLRVIVGMKLQIEKWAIPYDLILLESWKNQDPLIVTEHEDMVKLLSKDSNAKSLEQITKDAHFYMWLNANEVEFLMTRAAIKLAAKYRREIESILECEEIKPRSEEGQRKFVEIFDFIL